MRTRSGLPLTVGVVGLAIVGLFGLLPQFFTGTGDGDGDGEAEVGVTAETREEAAAEPTAEPSTITGYLDIIIDGEEYLVKMGDGERQPMSLLEIVSKAPKMAGNPDGVLVQVARRRSSVLSAEREIEKQLRDAGLKEEQVLMLSEMVD